MEDRENTAQIREAFQKSRIGAVLRCAEVMIDSGRKDVAKQILFVTKIDRNQLAKIKAQVTPS